MPMPELRILSNGLGKETQVLLDDGTIIPNIVRAVIWIDAGDVNKVELEIVNVKGEIFAHLSKVTLSCPICSHSETHTCEGKA